MCQAYDAEHASIVSVEHRQTIYGFAAARAGKMKYANPNLPPGHYAHTAWEQGWNCWHAKVLPWALERMLHARGDIAGGAAAREAFARDQTLSEELLAVVSRH